MTYLRRTIGLVIALTLVMAFIPTAAMPSYAQSAQTIEIDGSNIVAPVLKADADNYGKSNTNVKVDVNISGTDGGIEKLCQGQLDVAMASRAIKDSEIASCDAKGIKFVETVLGYDALVIIVNPAAQVTCLKMDQVVKLLGPSATGVNNWTTITTTTTAAGTPTPQPITAAISGVYAPFNKAQPDQSKVHVLADTLLGGGGLRSDLQPVDTAAQVVDKVRTDPSAVGILTLADYQTTAGTLVRAVQLNGDAGCSDTSQASLEQLHYPAVETLYLYANASSLDKSYVVDFLNYALGKDGQSNIILNGFEAADASIYTQGTGYLKDKKLGRSFSRIQAVLVPNSTTGTINVDGSPDVNTVLTVIKDAFTPRYTGITLNVGALGNTKAYSELCSGKDEVIGVTRQPTDDEAATCTKAGIKTMQLAAGANAVVLVANAKNTFATCLTNDQIWKLFGSDSDGKVKKWSDVNSSFPSNDLLLITPKNGSLTTDFLLDRVVATPFPPPIRRQDVNENDDAAYRATATGNNDNAITYMRFSEYQQLKLTTVKLVAVDGGKGCVNPTTDNFTNGTYPLSEPIYIIINLSALTRPEIKAFAWYLVSDDAITTFGLGGLVGTDTTKILQARDVLLDLVNQPAASLSPSGTAAATGAATGVAPAAGTVTPTPAVVGTAAVGGTTIPTLTPISSIVPSAVGTPAATAGQ